MERSLPDNKEMINNLRVNTLRLSLVVTVLFSTWYTEKSFELIYPFV